ncbi:MAG TPA: ABC transporter permease [Vicinamibacterales bacterium]|jgi:predicted permease|nr:ABC transporter permease [Vicinamibacterales bacterium]
MSIRSLTTRLESLFGRNQQELELDAELTYHIDMLTEQYVQRGMPRESARREALRVFGSVETVKDDVRDTWLSRFFEIAAQDVRYGIRSLRRSPGFAFVIILTMALGIGANTAIFSVVNGVLLRPLPYKDGDKLVELHHGPGDPTDPASDLIFSPKDIADYRLSPSLSDVVEFHSMQFTLLGRAEPLRVSTGVVSANYFDVLGIRPQYGRTFVAEDDKPGAPAVLVLTHDFWVKSFDEDPDVVGRVFRMNDKPHTVIGVLPPVPLYPFDGQGHSVDVYMPSSACPFRSRQAVVDGRSDGRMLSAFARVRPEATLLKSAADLDVTAARLQKDYPKDYPQRDFHAVAVPLKDEMTANFKPTLWILLATAGFVLLIVCASIANLLLARMVRRERELSVRAALGATRARILRQLLTESLLLAIGGGVVGLVLSAFAMKLLVAFAQRFTPRAGEISVDLTVLVFTFGISVATGLVFGSIPAFSQRIDTAPALRDGSRTSTASQRLRRVLIVAQISASFMLLIAAGLMLRSLMKVQAIDPGIRTDHLLTFSADVGFDKFPPSMPPQERRAKQAVYWQQFEQRLSALPGVSDAGAGGTFPLNDAQPFPGHLEREGHPRPPGVQLPQVSVRMATPDYFRTVGQPLLAGRVFLPSDATTAPQVAIINQTAAGQFWPNEDPIGTHILGGPNWTITVVGVVANVRQQLDHSPAAEVYVPLQQAPLLGTTWILKTDLPASELEQSVRAAAHAHDPALPVSSFRTIAEVRTMTLTPRRVIVALIGMFGLLALVITAAGIAGVVAFSVNQRTHEFGIRMALGAQRARVLSMVLREGLALVVVGLGIGCIGAAALAKLLGHVLMASSPFGSGPLLVDVPPTDLLTYMGVAAVLVLVALAACVTPARRAATVDPMTALRAQ